MARKKTVKITEDKIEIQGGDVAITAPVIEDCHIEIAEGVIAPSVQDILATTHKAIEDDQKEESLFPPLETLQEKAEAAWREAKAKQVHFLVETEEKPSFTATAEVVAESSLTMEVHANPDYEKLRKAIEKAKPLIQEFNELATLLTKEIKTGHHEWRSIYIRQQGELETILLLLGNLKHKLSLLAPDVAEFPVISRIKSEIFGEG